MFIVLLFTATAATAALDEDLVVYLTFDNVKGKRIFDASGNGLDAQVVGNTNFVRGKYHEAIQIPAETEECIKVPTMDALKISDEITMSAWLYRENWAEGSGFWFDKGIYAGMADKHAWGMAVFQVKDAHWDLGGLKGPVIVMILGGTGNQSRFSNTLLMPENRKWHHVAGTYDGAFVKIYLDGEVFFDSDVFGPIKVVPETNDQDLQIGCAKKRPQFAFDNGAIDEVALWSRPLTQAEIRTVMKGNILAVSPRDKAAITWGDIKRRTVSADSTLRR